MDMICKHCLTDTVHGPISHRHLCGVCEYDLHGEGTVVECGECGERKAINYYGKEKLFADKLCFTCDFWLGFVAKKDDPEIVRVGGVHYMVGEGGGRFAGFGGDKFEIEFFDGRKVVSHNVWHQGSIPLHFRRRLPDNARFVVRAGFPVKNQTNEDPIGTNAPAGWDHGGD